MSRRAHFLDAFIRHLPSGVSHFQKRLGSYSHVTSDGPLSLLFEDGSETECDLLVGCDGIKSTVRSQMLQDLARHEQPELANFIEPIWSGTIAYRGLIPVEKLVKGDTKHRTIDTPMMVSLVYKCINMCRADCAASVLWKEQGRSVFLFRHFDSHVCSTS